MKTVNCYDLAQRNALFLSKLLRNEMVFNLNDIFIGKITDLQKEIEENKYPISALDNVRCKSMVVSKSKERVALTMALFARFHVNGDMNELFSLFS